MSPADPVARLVEALELERLDDDVFEAANADRGFGPRVFGGQVAAQALRAALHTVAEPDRHLHSLHAYFLRPGRPGRPIRYEVVRIRDGRSFTTRQIVAHQDEPIFGAAVSLHGVEPGVDYQQPMSEVPAPDDAPEDPGILPDDVRDLVPMEFRELPRPSPDEAGYYPATRRVWMRIRRPLPDDPDLHASIIAFLSDMGAVIGARAPLPEQPIEKLMGASLDHALWFHRPMRADEWFLYELRAVSNANARGLAVGTMHTAEGMLGVSVAQEALLRVIDPARRKRSLADGPDSVDPTDPVDPTDRTG